MFKQKVNNFHFVLLKIVYFSARQGDYLIRPSSKSSHDYTIHIRNENRVRKLTIRKKSDNRYALGSEKINEVVSILIVYFVFKYLYLCNDIFIL